MNIRKNSAGLAVFNKILIANQILDSVSVRMPPGENKEHINQVSKMLQEACELLEKFVDGIKGEAV